VVWWSYKWKNKNKSEELLFDEYERMKESWMDKLIELLNEYDDNNWGVTDYWALFNRMNEWISGTEYLQVISKEFWFIQRLVKHFQLNVTKIDSRIALLDFNVTDRMLMALAISDNPIALLIDCLK
jgi:hypothetical protein